MRDVCHTANSSRFRPWLRRLAAWEPPLVDGRRRTQESHNAGPSVPIVNYTVVYINDTYSETACNTHALCSVCITNATTGEMDPYCEAFLSYYSYDSEIVRRQLGSVHSAKNQWHKYSAKNFWYNGAWEEKRGCSDT